jgi:hypothetical protein
MARHPQRQSLPPLPSPLPRTGRTFLDHGSGMRGRGMLTLWIRHPGLRSRVTAVTRSLTPGYISVALTGLKPIVMTLSGTPCVERSATNNAAAQRFPSPGLGPPSPIGLCKGGHFHPRWRSQAEKASVFRGAFPVRATHPSSGGEFPTRLEPPKGGEGSRSPGWSEGVGAQPWDQDSTTSPKPGRGDGHEPQARCGAAGYRTFDIRPTGHQHAPAEIPALPKRQFSCQASRGTRHRIARL